jgi:hypothetical protein
MGIIETQFLTHDGIDQYVNRDSRIRSQTIMQAKPHASRQSAGLTVMFVGHNMIALSSACRQPTPYTPNILAMVHARPTNISVTLLTCLLARSLNLNKVLKNEESEGRQQEERVCQKRVCSRTILGVLTVSMLLNCAHCSSD